MEADHSSKWRAASRVGQICEPALDHRHWQSAGLADVPKRLRSREKVSADCARARRSVLGRHSSVAHAVGIRYGVAFAGLLRVPAESTRELWPGRKIYRCQREGFWLR